MSVKALMYNTNKLLIYLPRWCLSWLPGMLVSSGVVVGGCCCCALRYVETASMIRGKLVWVSGELASETSYCSLEIVCWSCRLASLLANVAELEFSRFLDELVWVAETDESCRA